MIEKDIGEFAYFNGIARSVKTCGEVLGLFKDNNTDRILVNQYENFSLLISGVC